MQDVRIFGLSGTERYAQRVADYLDMPLSPHTEKYFSDTESYLKSDVNVSHLTQSALFYILFKLSCTCG